MRATPDGAVGIPGVDIQQTSNFPAATRRWLHDKRRFPGGETVDGAWFRGPKALEQVRARFPVVRDRETKRLLPAATVACGHVQHRLKGSAQNIWSHRLDELFRSAGCGSAQPGNPEPRRSA